MTNIPNKESCSFTTWELAKCQKAFNELQEKYLKLVEFVKSISCKTDTHTCNYGMTELCEKAQNLLKEIGELE